jgi:hypothetical protein
MFPPKHALTTDGYDLELGTNVLGHWYLTKLVLPALMAASTPKFKARVVEVSSNAAYAARNLIYESFREGPARQQLGQLDLYAQSKLVSDLGSNCAMIRFYSQLLSPGQYSHIQRACSARGRQARRHLCPSWRASNRLVPSHTGFR